ncbi:hypothetical protein ACFQV2_37575 [Actinokineospora soli]|uniref:Uncharacterized protein n=1 Tax=Actinokineospora soli TaxID=1048753 RepID=A0ABW2TWG0_9PSEU
MNLVPGFVVAGLLTLPIYRAGLLRERFLGDHVVPADALGAVVLIAVAVALLSLLRRDFIRADPARLTWDDPGDRAALVRPGLVRAWALRFGVVAYVFVAGGAVLGWAGALPVSAVVVAAAVFGFVAAWSGGRSVSFGAAGAWVRVVPFGVALAGALFVGEGVLWGVAGALVIATGLACGPAYRPGRRALVRGHRAHVLRSVASAFGDVLAVLPRARPTRFRLGSAARFVVGGVVARRGMAGAAVLLALAAPVLHAVFPVVAPVWWAGLGAYFATLPFGGGMADVVRVEGLRRWVPHSDTALWTAAVVVFLVIAGLWLAAAVLAGLPAVPQALPVAAAAVARTVSRPELDYSPSPALDMGGLYLPVNLVRQLVRGPLLLVFGLTALS